MDGLWTWLRDGWPYLLGALAFAWLCWWSRRSAAPGFAYEAKPIMNDGEWACYEALLRAADGECRVFAQVSLYALARHLSADGWPRIAQKSCDFALVSIQTRRAVLVIEVDGSQHRTSERQMRRDQDKDAVLAAAGIPVLRIPAAKRYDPIHLASAIRAARRDSGRGQAAR